MDYINELIGRYQNKGLLIDTNLLLLYFVGAYDPERIPRFKRTMSFTVDEFWLLAKFYSTFNKVITTPNILTEVSNLLGQLSEDLRQSFYTEFAKRIPDFEEHYTTSARVSAADHFIRFGLTDSGIADLVQGNYLVLTDDLRLARYLENRQIDVINFNHLRPLTW